MCFSFVKGKASRAILDPVDTSCVLTWNQLFPFWVCLRQEGIQVVKSNNITNIKRSSSQLISEAIILIKNLAFIDNLVLSRFSFELCSIICWSDQIRDLQIQPKLMVHFLHGWPSISQWNPTVKIRFVSFCQFSVWLFPKHQRVNGWNFEGQNTVRATAGRGYRKICLAVESWKWDADITMVWW